MLCTANQLRFHQVPGYDSESQATFGVSRSDFWIYLRLPIPVFVEIHDAGKSHYHNDIGLTVRFSPICVLLCMKIDHIHFFVEDAAHHRDWLIRCLGWKLVGQATLPDRQLEILCDRHTYFALSSPRTDDSPVAQYLRTYAPGVADVAIEVDDLAAVLRRGIPVSSCEFSPAIALLADLEARSKPRSAATIAGWGSVSHTLVERRSAPQRLIGSPLTQLRQADRQSTASGIDHIVLNVPAGELAAAVEFYQDLLGFQQQQHFHIQTERSGLQSQVLCDSASPFYFNINQPTSANSQIQAFLDANHGAGIQHIALHSEPILNRVAALRQRGLPLLSVPPTYYHRLQERLQGTKVSPLPGSEWQQIVEQQILIDWQPESPEALLLQIFSLPIFPNAHFFFEFIERRAAVQGFGERNFLALYEAIEAELQLRSSDFDKINHATNAP